MSKSEPPQHPEERGERYLTLVEHLQELRFRVMVSALAIIIGLGISTIFTGDIIQFLKDPAEERSDRVIFIFTEPFGGFVPYFQVAMLGGVILAMPVLVYQVLKFVSPGLRGSERWWIIGTVIGATGFFLAGVAFAYYVALPPSLGFLLEFGNDVAEPNIRIGSYIDFVTRLLFWTGISFETPLIVMYLARFGLVTAGQLVRWWRLAVVGAFVVSAIVTPTIDPVTQSLVAGPIIVLYFLGIGFALVVQPRRKEQTGG